MSYIYIQSEPGIWTTGFYKPDGFFETDKDFDNRDLAAQRVHFLNGGCAEDIKELCGLLTCFSDGGYHP